MDILTLTNTPLKKAWEVELREGRKDLHPVEHRGRVFTPWQSTAIVDYNSFSRPCGLLDIVSQCRRRAFILVVVSASSYSVSFEVLQRPLFLSALWPIRYCLAVSETGLYSCRCFSFVVSGVFRSSSKVSISFGPVAAFVLQVIEGSVALLVA